MRLELAIFSVFFIGLCIWAIDISVTAIMFETQLTNGFWFKDPLEIYHMALYGILIMNLIVCLVLVKEKEKENKKRTT